MSIMANGKIIIDPSKWIIDENNKINFRYKIITDDFNIRSATSPTYSVTAPAINEIFTTIKSTIVSEAVGASTTIKVNWTVEPEYTDMKYFVYLQTPADTAPIYNKTVSDTSFTYVINNADPNADGTYVVVVTMPTTTKKVTTYTTLFTKTIVI